MSENYSQDNQEKMDNEKKKETLSYFMADFLHEAWKMSRRKDDETYVPRIMETKDEKWIKEHGTNTIDITLHDFYDLPFDCRGESLQIAKAAIDIVDQKNLYISDNISEEERKEMSEKLYLAINDINNEEKTNGKIKPYSELLESEKNEYKNKINLALDISENADKVIINQKNKK